MIRVQQNASWTRRLIAGGTALLITIILGAKGADNARGVCSDAGRKLTPAELSMRLLSAINTDILDGRDGSGGGDYRTRDNRMGFPGAELVDLNLGDGLSVTIYPETPAYARTNTGEYDNAVFEGYHAFPVSLYYKITGHAYYLVFVDVRLRFKSEQGAQRLESMSRRTWVNACGALVDFPKSYETG